MSKGARTGRQNARERIAAQRAAARRAEMRNRILIAGASVLVVVAVVVVFVVVKLGQGTPGSHTGSHSGSGTSVTGTALPAAVARQVTGVPASVLGRVAAGSVPAAQGTIYAGTPVKRISGAPLTQGGKPEMLYIGAEFCPYCAELRWSMAVALSRFGTFTTPLHGIHSSATDVFPATPTLTFYKSSYTSTYLVFTPVENETVTKAPLQATTPQQQAIWNKYDANSYPFIDFGGRYMIDSPIYDPQVLHGHTWAQVAAALHDPANPIAQGADGAANYITAVICKMTGNKPASACAAPAIGSLEARL